MSYTRTRPDTVIHRCCAPTRRGPLCLRHSVTRRVVSGLDVALCAQHAAQIDREDATEAAEAAEAAHA